MQGIWSAISIIFTGLTGTPRYHELSNFTSHERNLAAYLELKWL
jgi:hypothetical protein